MTLTTERVYRPNKARYAAPFSRTFWSRALPSSEKVSVLSRALFTGREPPGAFLPDLHRALDNFVEKVGVVAEHPDDRARRRRDWWVGRSIVGGFRRGGMIEYGDAETMAVPFGSPAGDLVPGSFKSILVHGHSSV
jgi:hypothetical protein